MVLTHPANLKDIWPGAQRGAPEGTRGALSCRHAQACCHQNVLTRVHHVIFKTAAAHGCCWSVWLHGISTEGPVLLQLPRWAPVTPGDTAQLSPAGWLLPGAHTVYLLLESIPCSASGANQTCSTWNLNVHHHKHWFPSLKRQRKQLSFYFQGATAASTKENRGRNTFLKPFPKTFAICMLDDGPCPHTVWFQSNIFAACNSFNQLLPTGYRNITNPRVHNS